MTATDDKLKLEKKKVKNQQEVINYTRQALKDILYAPDAYGTPKSIATHIAFVEDKYSKPPAFIHSIKDRLEELLAYGEQKHTELKVETQSNISNEKLAYFENKEAPDVV